VADLVIAIRLVQRLGWLLNIQERKEERHRDRRLPGGSATLGVINTAVTRGRMEFYSRGGGGTGLQGPNPKKKKIKKKSRRKKLFWLRSQVPPRRAALELWTKLGSQTQTCHAKACMWVRGQNAGGSVWKNVSFESSVFIEN